MKWDLVGFAFDLIAADKSGVEPFDDAHDGLAEEIAFAFNLVVTVGQFSDAHVDIIHLLITKERLADEIERVEKFPVEALAHFQRKARHVEQMS